MLKFNKVTTKAFISIAQRELLTHLNNIQK